MASKTKRNIVRSIEGKRYLLTSRRMTELDSEGTPWFTTSKELREAAKQLPYGIIRVFSKVRPRSFYARIVTVQVTFGKDSNSYRVGCAIFTFSAFKRILRAVGVKGTQKKAFAAQAGA